MPPVQQGVDFIVLIINGAARDGTAESVVDNLLRCFVLFRNCHRNFTLLLRSLIEIAHDSALGGDSKLLLCIAGLSLALV